MVQYYFTRNKKFYNLVAVPSNFGGFSTVTVDLKPGAVALAVEKT